MKRTPTPKMPGAAAVAAASLVVVAALAGCGGYAVNLPDRTKITDATWEQLDAEKRAGYAAWEARHKGTAEERAASIRKAIGHLDKASAIDPLDRSLYADLSAAQYYLGNYFTEAPAEKVKVHEKGMEYAIRGLLANPEVKAAFDKNEQRIWDAVGAAGPGDIQNLFWLGSNWGRFAEPQGLATRAAEAPKVKKIQERTYALGETLHYGGVHRFFGVYYLKAPAQPDPVVNSKKHFDRALEIGPNHLENYLLYAEEYATKMQDEKLYRELLAKVIEFPESKDPPDLRIVNWRSRIRAKELLTDDAIAERF